MTTHNNRAFRQSLVLIATFFAMLFPASAQETPTREFWIGVVAICWQNDAAISGVECRYGAALHADENSCHLGNTMAAQQQIPNLPRGADFVDVSCDRYEVVVGEAL